MLKTVKFGGSSLADAQQFMKAARIIRADESRRYVVVSAPGKRFDHDTKITDLFYRCCDAARRGADFTDHLEQIKARYDDIVRGLGIELDLSHEFFVIRNSLRNDPDVDYAASRGEYLSAIVMAAYLSIPMVDAADCIRFREEGYFDAERTQALLSARLEKLPRAVIPGFYGSLPDGSIRTFSRGGSDISGAIVARASNSDLYENWTDVSGMLTCDPRIIENPKPIDTISYAELRELAYMGATVMHEAAIFPVKKAGIPINIRNTNSPDDPGTMILPNTDDHPTRSITGIAGRKNFTIIQLVKEQMNEATGFAMRALQVLARYGLSAEHIPSGIDILSIVLSTDLLKPHRAKLIEDLQRVTQAESVSVSDGVALLTVVGRGMINTLGAAGRIFTTLGNARVNVKMIDQGSGELNLIIGIDEADFEKAIRALYNEFF